MNRTEIKKVLDELTVDVTAITDPRASAAIKVLINLVEILVEQNSALQEANQQLKDENNRLKGEQGKPDIRKQSGGDDNNNTDHSSENDRKKRNKEKKRKQKMKKKGVISINRRETIVIDKSILPEDVIFKGYEKRIIQDIKFSTDNIEFSLQTYYSPLLKKTFIADLPAGYHGEFGPGIRAMVITLYRDSGMTEPAIERFFKIFGTHISKSTISRMITEGHDCFHDEKEKIIDAAFRASEYQHIDDTGCRVNGKNHYTHILCNPYFTAFFTRLKKDRLTILEILCRDELKYKFNEESYSLMVAIGLSYKCLAKLKKVVREEIITRSEVDGILKLLFPNPKKYSTSRRVILESSAIAYYRDSEFSIFHLICDDAPQFNLIARFKALCWIHEGRHYKKLNPVFAAHRVHLDNFIEQFWDYYEELLAYKQNPTNELAKQLSEGFATLFSKETGYDALDKRIAMTLAKKEALLLVLKFPFLPLHNNPAESGARVQARMRDINLQTISKNGTRTKDTFATIVQTARKLGVNIYDYVYDRISEKYSMPSLESLIAQQPRICHNTS
jgi:hypothetical protein